MKNSVKLLAIIIAGIFNTVETKVSTTKTDKLETVKMSLPPTIIQNKSNSHEVTVTNVETTYKIKGNSTDQSASTSTKISIPTKKSASFGLTIELPIPANKKNIEFEPLGVSEIKVQTSKKGKILREISTIKISPPWNAASKENAICINYDKKKWKLDKCKKAEPSSTKKTRKSAPLATTKKDDTNSKKALSIFKRSVPGLPKAPTPIKQSTKKKNNKSKKAKLKNTKLSTVKAVVMAKTARGA